MQLLITGTQGKGFEQFIKELSSFKYRDEVQVMAGRPATEQAKIMAAAYAFVFPSLSGDFPSLTLTAMQSGVPVIASGHFSFPEILGSAALYADPGNFNAIAEKMMLVYKDEQKRKALISEGFVQAKKYDRDIAANSLWQAITGTIQPETA